jgi:hypothetical protein
MKVIHKEEERKSYSWSEIKPGDVFSLRGDKMFFLKIKDDTNVLNAFNLKTNKLDNFAGTASYTKYDAELLIK